MDNFCPCLFSTADNGFLLQNNNTLLFDKWHYIMCEWKKIEKLLYKAYLFYKMYRLFMKLKLLLFVLWMISRNTKKNYLVKVARARTKRNRIRGYRVDRRWEMGLAPLQLVLSSINHCIDRPT